MENFTYFLLLFVSTNHSIMLFFYISLFYWYSKAPMYTAPRCTDLTDTRFFLGPKIFYLHGFSQSCTVFPNKIIFGFKYTSNSKSKSKRTYSSLSIHFKISSRSRCLLNYLKASLEYNQNQPILKITSLH